MESVEAAGKSIEDAILQALARLGRNRDEVDIVVRQEQSRGSRGMGAREARVRATVLSAPGSAAAPSHGQAPGGQRQYRFGSRAQRAAAQATPLAPPPPTAHPPLPQPYEAEADDGAEFAGPEEDGEDFADEYALPDDEEEGEEEGEFAGQAPAALPVTALHDLLPEDASIEEFAVAALETILGHMGVRGVAVQVEDTAEDEPLILNVVSLTHAANGSLSFLIGRRGETLAAIQLLVNLVTSKQTGERERIIVDVQNYRHRREDNLRVMAERIAQQVRASGLPVTLEAMPPNERRIIHMALADYEDLSTESTGEGDQRRVVVALKHAGRTTTA